MKAPDRFIDTNVVLYLLSGDHGKADRAERVLLAGGVVSIQVLNEFASVASRKLRMTYAEIREILVAVRAACDVVPLTEATHDDAIELAERYRLPLYDALLFAAARLSGCRTLLSEDFQDGQVLQGVRIRNPFK